MTGTVVQQLEVYGPDRCAALAVEDARRWCRRLAGRRYENFSVLSGLVPRPLRDDYAALYAFCRWADDLGDEVGDPARSHGSNSSRPMAVFAASRASGTNFSGSSPQPSHA